VCWKCGKEGHLKKDCRYKYLEKIKGFDGSTPTEAKTTSDEGGYLYLASSLSTHVYHEAWLIESGASFHFTLHKEWFYKYEKYDGVHVFLGEYRKDRIIERGKVKLKLQGGMIRKLLVVLHIPKLARNMIFVSKMNDTSVKTVFEKDTYNMVWGALLLMWGVRIRTWYKLLGSTVIDGYNSLWFLKVKQKI